MAWELQYGRLPFRILPGRNMSVLLTRNSAIFTVFLCLSFSFVCVARVACCLCQQLRLKEAVSMLPPQFLILCCQARMALPLQVTALHRRMVPSSASTERDARIPTATGR